MTRRSVLEAATARMRAIFDDFARVVVSVSGGKDSTCLFHLAHAEAVRRGREIELFFLDQEAEYQATIDVIESMMMTGPSVVPRWYQVPLALTNATSPTNVFLQAWAPGAVWMRPKHPRAIHASAEPHPSRFYAFFPWLEAQATGPTAHLVGLRMFESLNRQRATSTRPGYRGFRWSTPAAASGSYRFYPIYDWHARDVWKFIADTGVPYNRMYDLMYASRGSNLSTMRVSNLIHEKSFRSLAQLHAFEPETYERLLARLDGVHCAALYAEAELVFDTRRRPGAHSTWRAYRDYLVGSTPGPYRERFAARFARQADDEATCRQQVKQVLVNDGEGSLGIHRIKASALRAAWWDRL